MHDFSTFPIEYQHDKSFGAYGMEKQGNPERLACCFMDIAGVDACDGIGRLYERAIFPGF